MGRQSEGVLKHLRRVKVHEPLLSVLNIPSKRLTRPKSFASPQLFTNREILRFEDWVPNRFASQPFGELAFDRKGVARI